jgi:hypothetical protein
MASDAPSRFTFDEVVQYVQGLVGRNVRVGCRSANRSETGAYLEGQLTAVHTFRASNPPSELRRHFCQVGEHPGSGFILSPHDFESARIDLQNASDVPPLLAQPCHQI